MGKRKKSEIKGAAPWLVTMGDMNNLLMCFFIVMMGDITVVTQQEFLLTLTSFRGSLGVLSGGKSLTKGQFTELGHNIMALPSRERTKEISKGLKNLNEAFKPEIQSKYVRITEDERGLVITLTGDFFFDPGSARIKENAFPILKKTAALIKNIQNFVRIEGHTDNSSVTVNKAKELYRSNWELSSSRGLGILHYLTDAEGVTPNQLSVVAFGEYRPLDDNNTPEGRAYNRRVDIVVTKQRYLQKSTNPRIGRPLPDEEWR